MAETVFQALLLSLALLLGSPMAWAREFRARAGEPVAASHLLVRLKPGAAPGRVFAELGTRFRPLGGMNLHIMDVAPGARAAASARVASHPAVEYVEPDRVRHTTIGPPNDPSFGAQQWALQAVQALQAWRLAPNRYLSAPVAAQSRVKVAVLDTGADCTHPDFQNAGGSSTDAAAGGQLSFAGSRAVIPTTITAPACAWQDDLGHGTHVAGIIAAAANNGTGVVGLGYPVQLLIYKVMDVKGKGVDSNIVAAIMAAADAGAAVISLSLGGEGYSQALQDAITYAWRANSLVVAAAGNQANGELFFPAAANHVMAVAASDNSGRRAAFCNYGESIDVAAPGVAILSTMPTYPAASGIQDYGQYSGTSMAAPLVSALGGLIAMTTPGLAADAIGQRIERATDPADTAGGWGRDLGYGIINAWSALSGNLRPASAGGIAGQVVDAAGLPVAGATVRLGSVSVITGDAGLFRIANQPAGTYQLVVSAPPFPSQPVPVVVLAGCDTPVTVPMGVPLGTITGTISADGAPLAGAVVQAREGGLVQASASADATGRYWLALPSGTYDLRVSAISFVAATAAAQPAFSGRTRTLDFRLAPMGWIAGTVTDAHGGALASAEIEIDGDGFAAGATTDASGAYTSAGLPAGTYTVSTAANGLSATSPPIAVSAGGGTRVDLRVAPFEPIRVNCGGPAVTDSAGNSWRADTGYAAGGVFSTTAAISGTGMPVLYQTERWGVSTYRFDVPKGTYTVTLKFAELFFSQPRQRVFSVAINGRKMLSHFDIVAQAGGRYIALDRQFTVQAAAGGIAIALLAEVENPKLNALEIVPANSADQAARLAVAPASVLLAPSQTQQFSAPGEVTWSIVPALGTISPAGLYTAPAAASASDLVVVRATSIADAAQSATAVVQFIPSGCAAAVHVNAGGGAVEGFSADAGYSGGRTYSTPVPIAAGAIYQSERYGAFSYVFPVSNGVHRVTLHFAEISMSRPRQRIFDVAINGQAVLQNFDILGEASGPNVAIVKQFLVWVINGQVAIDFIPVVENAKVSAIKIE